MNWIKLLVVKAKENSSLRKIQLQFLVILFIAAMSIIVYQWYQKNWSYQVMLISTCLILLISGIIYVKPVILKPILFIWLLLGLFLGEITSTIIIGIIFYFLFFPITFILRMKNRKKEIYRSRWVFRENDTIDYHKLY